MLDLSVAATSIILTLVMKKFVHHLSGKEKEPTSLFIPPLLDGCSILATRVIKRISFRIFEKDFNKTFFSVFI